jgi:hypothetical protein
MLFLETTPQFVDADGLILPVLECRGKCVEVNLLDYSPLQPSFIGIHQSLIIKGCAASKSFKGSSIFFCCHPSRHFEVVQILTSLGLSV